jgi:hypothetical protein
MSVWGRLTYGDPCRECGFQWPLTLDDAVSIVGSTPDDVADALAGRDPASHHPDLTWSALAYVCHITDNLRIWRNDSLEQPLDQRVRSAPTTVTSLPVLAPTRVFRSRARCGRSPAPRRTGKLP